MHSPPLFFLGTKISNDTGVPNVPEWVYDQRFYLPLCPPPSEEMLGSDISNTSSNRLIPLAQQVNKYNLADAQYKINHNRTITRITLWFANTMNIPSEVSAVEERDIFSTKQGKEEGDRPLLNIGIDKHRTKEFGAHLYPTSISGVFGGCRGPIKRATNQDQIIHVDVGTTKKKEREYSVSTNPDLQGLFKCSGLIIPLDDHRDLMQLNDSHRTDLRIRAGQAHVFAGDSAHAGITTEPEDPMKWHPALHMIFMSTHHPTDLGVFEIDIVAVGSQQPELLSRLHPDAKLDAIQPLSKAAIDGYRGALVGDVDGRVKKSLDNLILKLQSLSVDVNQTPETFLSNKNKLEQQNLSYKRKRYGNGDKINGEKMYPNMKYFDTIIVHSLILLAIVFCQVLKCLT